MNRTYISYLVVSVLLLKVLVVNIGMSAPVIVTGDSGGSWGDSFGDDTGIEDCDNVTVEKGNVKLTHYLPFNGTNWTKHGVVLDNGGLYDLYYVANSQVLKEGGIYKMWYAGYNGTNHRILYATSNDGINWTKSSYNPVINLGQPGDDDDFYANVPALIKDAGTYKMWYAGHDGSVYRIMYATSPEGINWTKYGTVLTGQSVAPGTVIKDGGMYKMWYHDQAGGNWRIYYANSTDGTNWTKNGMVLDISPGGLDDTHVGAAAVIKENDNLYRMWYSGHDGSGYRVFYAVSVDETNWIKQGLAVDRGNPGELDDTSLGGPGVLKDDDGFYKMWYTGNDGSGNMRVLYATSPYPTNPGFIKSTAISLPAGQTWKMLTIDKEEPGTDNFINVTILDAVTNEPIPGFENLTGTSLDISTIDYLMYPSIRLYATFLGNNSATPVLHEWSASWHDTIPPDTPTGLIINNPFTGYSLIVSWDSNSEVDLDNYVIYISTNNISFNWLTNISAGTITFTDYGLNQGITYYYKIAAADEVPNQSPFSYVVEGVPDTDYDGDNIGDIDDPDDDNDGIPDFSDSYPLNPLNDIESTIDFMNTTIDDIQTRVIIIQTILENLNFTEMLNLIKYLNQTLPPKIDDLSTQLDGVNDSLTGMVTDAEVNILSYLATMDASLSNEIQNALVSITNDVIDMNTSVSDELTTLLNTMITEHDGLQQWLELVLGLIDSNLTATNNTLHSQLDYLDQSITNFYNNLEDDIGDVLSDLLMHDQNTRQNHTEIIGLLLDLLDGQIEKEQIDDLKTRLINLANDLSGHNQIIADDIMDVVNDIDSFESNINQQLMDINKTLDQLAKLEEILGDLEELDLSLEQAEESIQDSVDDRSTRDEDEERFFMIELFLIILFILLIINLIATILMGKRRKGENPPVTPKSSTEEKPEEFTSPPQSIEQEEPAPSEPSASEERLPPPRPPIA